MPPCCQRLATPIGMPSFPRPKKIMEQPIAIIATIATTLISENQNSNSPKTFTATKLIPPIARIDAKAHIHCGVSGNQSVI